MISTSLNTLLIFGDHTRNRDEFQVLMKEFKMTIDSVDDSPLAFQTILRMTNLEYAIDCCSAAPQHSAVWRSFALRCANKVQKYITLEACRSSFEAAERFSRGEISEEELSKHYEAARKAWFVKGSLGVFSQVDTERLFEIEYFSNQAALEVANPDISWGIAEVHKATSYVLTAVGMDEATVIEIQTREFLDALQH